MSLRIKWIGKRILETFEPDVSQDDVNDFLSTSSTETQLEQLMTGDIKKVFVHFQDENIGVQKDTIIKDKKTHKL